MGINLGSSAVTLYLGDQPVNAYLGETLLTAPTVRLLYFTGAVDTDWSNLLNWFNDAGGTVAASSLPTAADSVVATASIQSNSAEVSTTVTNFTIGGGLVALSINITVTGMATFNDQAGNNATVTGNATFNDESGNNGTVTGTVTCNTTGVCTPT